ncbi:MAG TPA: arginine--tRNA ligase [Kofleriaceae bacterium]|jgi:arginyl-tRNA synthetase
MSLTPLHAAAAEVVAAHAGVSARELKVDATPRPELGDLAVGCFAIAKATKQSPAAVAQAIAAAFQPNEWLASATAAGPFVNFRANRAAAFRWLVDGAAASALLPQIGAGQTICIDFGSPNISKHLAYHHIRGTTIGHSLARTLRALGSRVVGINFLGDWGTTHGMLIAAWKKWGPIEPLDVSVLNDLYVRFRAAMEHDPSLEPEGRAWFKKLEGGDADARALWQRFRDVSWAEFETIYKLLGIEYDEVRGESAYEPDLPGVVTELKSKGLVEESEGAQVVFLDGEKTPFLLVKQDGTTLYATRDIAAAEYHWNEYQFTRMLYVVAREQGLHFRQLFKVLAKAGHAWSSRCEHVPYGLVRLGGKKTATRLGNVVLMKQVFDIASAEVRERIAAANPEMTEAQIEATALDVGIGAVVFANLASQRDKDVDFDIEKAVSIEGDSGPYLQYSHARCASIRRKAPPATGAAVELGKLATDAEWAVARRLLDYPEHVVRAATNSEPHVIAHYLLELAAEFSRWYTAGNGDASLRVLVDDVATREARLALVATVQSVMAQGLSLLGLAAPAQM